MLSFFSGQIRSECLNWEANNDLEPRGSLEVETISVIVESVTENSNFLRSPTKAKANKDRLGKR